MDKLVLFTKSYSGDLERCKILSESILKHNIDKIPFYVSVPLEEISLFQRELPYVTEILADEHITDSGHGWVGQQMVKSKFYKTDISQFYVCIDSDAYFINDFYINDFLYSADVPYLVMHDRIAFYEFMDRYSDELFGFDVRETHEKEYKDIRKYLTGDESGRLYHYGISPYVWDTEIWEYLDNTYGIDLLFSKYANELKWYGEAALSYGKDFMPRGPYFKEFHYEAQYEFYKQLGWNENHFKKQYLGIVMQSNWGSPLRYEE